MAHRLLHKLSITRKYSVPTAPTTSSGISSDTAAAPDSPPSSSTANSTSPAVHPRCSNPPIPLVILPPPDFRSGPGSRRPCQRVNLFKKFLGKQAVPARLTAPKSRPRKTWERELEEFRFDASAGARDENNKESSPKVKTPTSWELHWDCAKTEYRDSTEVRTPIFSSEGLALCELPSPADIVYPNDYQPTRRTTTGRTPKEILSSKGDSYNEGDPPPPAGSSAIGRPPSPAEHCANKVSPTNNGEQNVVVPQVVDSPSGEEDAGPQFNPPERERHTHLTSLVLRPTSMGGPPPQTLSPPPVKVSLAVRRGTNLPSRLPPTPSPRIRPRGPVGRSQLLSEPVHNVSDPGSPASVTPEEGLIQLQIRAQHTDSHAPLGYVRSFKHVRGLNSRTLPTTSRIPHLSITPASVRAHPDSLDGAEVRLVFEELLDRSISACSSDESEHVNTPPDDTIPGISITSAGKGSSAASYHPHFSICVREDKYASSFLDFEPGTPLSPLPPATQSPFSISQYQLFISSGFNFPEFVDQSAEESHAGPFVDDYRELCSYAIRRLARPIPSSSMNSGHGHKTRPSPLGPDTQYTETRSSAYYNCEKTGRGGVSNNHSTVAVGQSHRRQKSGVRRTRRPRSRSGNNAARKSYDGAANGTTGVINGIGLRPEISSRMKNMGHHPPG